MALYPGAPYFTLGSGFKNRFFGSSQFGPGWNRSFTSAFGPTTSRDLELTVSMFPLPSTAS
jgi:hypothetical protein